MIHKLTGLFFAILIVSFQAFTQDYPEVTIIAKDNQSEATINEDKKECYTSAEEQWHHTKHKTLKNTGIGTGIGAIIGKIFGKPGAGAAVGGAAGAYRGHKESKEDQREFNNLYASCLREKGYDVLMEED